MYPDFLCIGAQKAGTTWLYDNIKDHPQVWMAPVKEIFYFDRPTWLPLALQLCAPSAKTLRQHTFGGVAKRLKGRDTATAPSPAPAAAAAPDRPWPPPGPRQSSLSRAWWHTRFMLWPRTDRWYGSLFRPAPGQIAGDINPYIARLDRDVIARIKRLMPDTKILYLMRNPIHRIWSQVGMSMKERNIKSLDDIDPEVLKRVLEIGSQEALSDYAGNVRKWREFYPESQTFLGFFDQLVEDPPQLLRDVFEFLEIDSSDRVIPPTARRVSNKGSGPRIPPAFLEHLTELFLPQLEDLHGLFANAYTERWLDEARGVPSDA